MTWSGRCCSGLRLERVVGVAVVDVDGASEHSGSSRRGRWLRGRASGGDGSGDHGGEEKQQREGGEGEEC